MRKPGNLRVAMLPGSVSRHAGGLFTSVRRLSESIRSAEGITVDVIGNRDSSTEDDIATWNQPPTLIDRAGILNSAKQVNEILKRIQPDVLHPQFLWSYGSVATHRYHRATKAPYVVSARGMLDPWAVSHRQWKKRLAAFLFESRHLRDAACLHALCDSEADAMRAYGLSNRIEVIPNGIDLAKETVTRESPRGSSKNRLLFLGRLHAKKGVHFLLDAWADVTRGPDKPLLDSWTLQIAGFGDDDYEQLLQNRIRDHKLESSVQVLGPVTGKRKEEVLANADGFILPSQSEGLPMSILEAWAYRQPVIMTRACNLEIGFDEKAAIEIEPKVRSIASGLVEFCRLSQTERDAIGENGFELVKDRFQWSAIASQMADVYRSLVTQ